MDSTSRPAEFDGYGVSRRNDGAPSVRWVLADLVFVTAIVVAILGLALGFDHRGGPMAVRVPLGFLFVFFLPGYALAAALFPRADHEDRNRPSDAVTLTAVERGVLSVGLSLVLVPLLAIGLTMVGQPTELLSVLATVGGFTVSLAALAAVRRFRLPPAERFHVSPGPTVDSTVGFLRADALNVVLVLVLVLAVGGIGAALMTAENGTTFTEFAVLAESEDGNLSAADYPAELTTGETERFHVAIENYEHRPVEYTVVVLLEDVGQDGEPVTATELDRFGVELAHGDRTVEEHAFEPRRTGEGLRLSYLLYVGDVPAEPTPANADQSTHVMLDVVP